MLFSASVDKRKGVFQIRGAGLSPRLLEHVCLEISIDGPLASGDPHSDDAYRVPFAEMHRGGPVPRGRAGPGSVETQQPQGWAGAFPLLR